MKHVIALRAGFVSLTDSGANNEQAAMSAASELMQFGYMPDTAAIAAMSKASLEDLSEFVAEVLAYLKEATGASRNYAPFWKGFPQEVMSKTELELWLHQILHYISNGAYEPSELTELRPSAFEHPKYTMLTAGSHDRFLSVFTDMVSANQSLSPDDRKAMTWFVRSGTELRMPSVVPFKETLCELAALGVDVPVKSVTDVLRIAVSMSGGDPSLPALPPRHKKSPWGGKKSNSEERDKFRFKKFSRKDRRFLLSLLEKTDCDPSEAVLKDGRWVRLGEVLHPGEMHKSYPKAAAMFDAVRSGKASSWYSGLQKAFAGSGPAAFESALEYLSKRPGEFMRRVDWLLRENAPKASGRSRNTKTELVLNYLRQAGAKCSNKVLFELYSHLSKRDKPTDRSVMIKGARKRTKLPKLDPLPAALVRSAQCAITDALREKFSSLPALGSVYIDPDLRKIPLPSNMRSASSTTKPIVRGTRLPIGNKSAKVVRAFVHWFDENGTQDIDLTVTLLGEKNDKTERLAWNGRHVTEYGCHSGDVRHRAGACAEYADIDVRAALEAGFRYAVMDANNFKGKPFHTVRECVFGYMEREHPESNSAFVPSTLAGCTQLTSEASTTVVAIIDLAEMEYIFVDSDMGGVPVSSCNVSKLLDIVSQYAKDPQFSVYHLLRMHADVRGTVVDTPGAADTSFVFDDFSTSYVETAKYMGV